MSQKICDFCAHEITANEIKIDTLVGWSAYLKAEAEERRQGIQRGGIVDGKAYSSIVWRPQREFVLHIDCATKLGMDVIHALRYFIQTKNFLTHNVKVDEENRKAGKTIIESTAHQAEALI